MDARFREILEYLCQDLTIEQIAPKLGLSHGRLNHKLRKLYKFLKVRSREEAVAWAQANGFEHTIKLLPFEKLRMEITELSMQGKSTKQIAARMKVSEFTVTYHLSAARSGESASKCLPSENKVELTPMFQKVLELVAQNFENKQIAKKLFLSENTIKTHLSRLLKELGVRSREEAALWGRANGYGQSISRALPFAKLSKLDLEVVKLLTLGRTNPEIDETLSFDKGGTKIRLRHISRQLKESDRGKIAASYIQFKLDNSGH